MQLEIRTGTTADASLLSHMGAATFYESYAAYNTAEDMDLYLKEHFTEAVLHNELTQPGVQFFIVYADGEPAGYTKRNNYSVQDALHQKKQIEIERIYVYHKNQGQKIGRRLIERVVSLAKENNYPVIWLGVWEHNTNAIAFYKDMGFTVFGQHDFLFGTDVQNDLLMCMEVGK